MRGRHLWRLVLLLLVACLPSSGSSGSFVVPTVSPAEQQRDDRRMEDEVARCHEAALQQPPIPAENAAFLADPIVQEGPFKECVVDIREVLVQMEHTGDLNHGQVRVTFQAGSDAVRLYPQGAPDGRTPVILDDITFTADGVRPLSTQQKVQIMTDGCMRLSSFVC